MDSKMTTLIEKLDLSDECKKVFETAKLDKIVGSKDKTNYCFYVSIDSNLDINIFEEFISKLKISFNSVKNVNCVLKVNNVNYDLVNDYFKYIIRDTKVQFDIYYSGAGSCSNSSSKIIIKN